jgi:hypothetical protein
MQESKAPNKARHTDGGRYLLKNETQSLKSGVPLPLGDTSDKNRSKLSCVGMTEIF